MTIAIVVLQVPSILSPDRMIDKLTIHFQRKRNGGGEVERVLFPTDIPDQAVIFFELPEVAACVLRQSHVLDVDGKHFPLVVRSADQPQVDMPARATLDLRMFPNQTAVHELLAKHRLRASLQQSGELLLQGTFRQLKAVRFKLQELQGEVGIAPKESQTVWEPYQHLYLSGARPKMPEGGLRNGTAVSDESRGRRERVEVNGAFRRGADTPLATLSDVQSLQSFSGSPGNVSTHAPQERMPSPGHVIENSFVTDTQVLLYIQRFYKDQLQTILEEHHVQMKQSTDSDQEISTVYLSAARLHRENLEEAKTRLNAFFSEVLTSLRTQEIDLSSLDREQQRRVRKQAQDCGAHFQVLVSEVNGTILLVGKSRMSFELKQRLLQVKDVRPPSAGWEGRGSERGTRIRRSYSLPHQPSRLNGPDPEPRPVAVLGSTASKYQGGRSQDPPLSTEANRRRSGSENRKNTDRAILAQNLSEVALPQAKAAQNLSEVAVPKGKTGKKLNVPLMKKPLIKDMGKNMKGLFSPRKKKSKP